MSLKITKLNKRYSNGVQALDNLSLVIEKGMFGLLGPNGAGKSTLMRTIATLQEPDSGEILLDEIDILADPMSLRKTLGYLPQEFGVFPRQSADSLLNYLSILKGIKSKSQRSKLIDHVLEITNLTADRKKHVSSYSGGMRQRFGIAQLLLNNPRLIIVDEPTSGLDPAERNRFLNVLRSIGTKSTVIFSTHIVEDITDLCTDMAIVNNGQLVLQDRPSNVTNLLKGKLWCTDVEESDLAVIKTSHQVLSSHFTSNNLLRVKVFSEQSPGNQFTRTEGTMEDLYFAALNDEIIIDADDSIENKL